MKEIMQPKGIRKTLCIIIVLPLMAWILEQLYHFPKVLEVLFGIDKVGAIGYAYCSLAGLILAVIFTCIFGLFALRKIKLRGDRVKVIMILVFWALTLLLYL
ncbi:MAG: hypothetical protein KAS23_12080, partial [Anaerohalosphaera sp.]|nr:hypothetical protein [Anaerohalosphaera sp.]